MNTNPNTIVKMNIKNQTKTRKRKSVIYKNQENNNNMCIIPDCDQVKKCIKFERELCLETDRSKLIFESFTEKIQRKDNWLTRVNSSASENGSMMMLFRDSIIKPNSYLRFEENEPIKRTKFH